MNLGERTILHSDMNCFYASVEMMLAPSLRGKPVAVCGSTENRHGIVLAKSELAKKAGVKTGMVNWEARQRCPNLIMVKPQYDQYLKYSELARNIYQRYTDQVEPYEAFEKFVSQLINKEKIDSIPGWIAELIEDEIFRRRGLRIIHQDKESRK